MKAKILIIDDDDKLNNLLRNYLHDFGFNVVTATHPREGLLKLKQETPDLVVLDVMLPEMDGFEVCKMIRKQNAIPIIMLTARGDLTDKVVGLEIGADDYLAKPFEPRELVARIHSVLRRTQEDNYSDLQTFGKMVINFSKRIVKIDGEVVELTTNEFALLSLLVKNSGKVLDRDQILDALRGIEWEAYNRSVDITMSRLRNKLKDNPKNPSFIKTIWGTGYVFIGNQQKEADESNE